MEEVELLATGAFDGLGAAAGSSVDRNQTFGSALSEEADEVRQVDRLGRVYDELAGRAGETDRVEPRLALLLGGISLGDPMLAEVLRNSDSTFAVLLCRLRAGPVSPTVVKDRGGPAARPTDRRGRRKGSTAG